MSISTGIFKEPVSHPVGVKFLNIDGDQQADLNVHGGPDKAVYAYAAEHYAAWKNELHDMDMPYGMFGENLTIEGGLIEDKIFVGDRFQMGTAELMAVQPRMPCYKLGIRFGDPNILKLYIQSRRYGVYFRVMKEGVLAAGDTVIKTAEIQHAVSIRDVGRLLMEPDRDPVTLKSASEVEELPEALQVHFRSLLSA